MPILVAGAMIVKAGQVLLGRRAPAPPHLPWRLGPDRRPSGARGNAGADADPCELGEEIGVTPTRFRAIAMIDFTQEAGEAVHFHLFRVDAFKGEPHLANDEHTALGWFDLAKAATLPDLASARYRPILLAEAEETA